MHITVTQNIKIIIKKPKAPLAHNSNSYKYSENEYNNDCCDLETFPDDYSRKHFFDYIDSEEFYIKNFIALVIQYFIILLSVILGIYYKINILLYEKYGSQYISLGCFAIIIIFISFICFNKCLTIGHCSCILTIFGIIYPPTIIYLSFLLSLIIESKYIITFLSLIFIYVISLGIHVLIFKKTQTRFISITSFILSLIGFLIFSFVWIKDTYGIIFISIIWILTYIYYILWVFISVRSTELDKYFYSVILLNYGIFLGFPFIIIKIIDYLGRSVYLRVFYILLYQFMIINIIAWTGFFGGLKIPSFLDWPEFTYYILGFIVILNMAICIHILYYIFCKKKDGCCWTIYSIIFIFFMSVYYYSFIGLIEDKYVLCFITTIFADYSSQLLLFSPG